MITRDDVIGAVELMLSDEVLEEWPQEEWEFDKSDAHTILGCLDVSNVGHRLVMYNISEFDLDDLVALANVDFSVVKCDMCGRVVYRVEPEDWSLFQSINTQGEIAPVDINGNEKQICDECYGHPIFRS